MLKVGVLLNIVTHAKGGCLIKRQVSKLWAVSCQEQVTVWRDDDDNDFVLDQHFEVNVDSVMVSLINMLRGLWRYQREIIRIQEGQATQWPKEKSTKGQTTIYKTYISN